MQVPEECVDASASASLTPQLSRYLPVSKTVRYSGKTSYFRIRFLLKNSSVFVILQRPEDEGPAGAATRAARSRDQSEPPQKHHHQHREPHRAVIKQFKTQLLWQKCFCKCVVVFVVFYRANRVRGPLTLATVTAPEAF